MLKAGTVRPKKAKALSLARWKSMKFSADGQSILIATDASLVLTLHAFEGDVKQVLRASLLLLLLLLMVFCFVFAPLSSLLFFLLRKIVVILLPHAIVRVHAWYMLSIHVPGICVTLLLITA